MGHKEVIAKENMRARMYEMRNFSPTFFISPPTFFIRKTLIYHIALRQILLCFFPLFPLKGNVLEPTLGFNKKMVRRCRN